MDKSSVATIGRDGAARRPTAAQSLIAAGLFCAIGAALHWAPAPAGRILHALFAGLFCLGLALRVVAAAFPASTQEPPMAALEETPRYTIIVPLYHEALMVEQLLAALTAIDYPRDRLQVLLALEADDVATHVAVRRAAPPPWIEIVTASPEGPRTKPHACNAALARATGECVVVFDAEDQPDPLQLREAAARFAVDDARLACLQAPLRILPETGFLRRQFALEYALLFEVMLPALATLGLPFPLGGTSNHFRTAALRAVGGWDDYNVTEDADIGLRLGREGYRLGVLRRPTLEAAPAKIAVWLPQRTRWIKGHMQTFGVHARSPLKGGWRSAASLQLVLGLNILSSLLHGPLILGVAACFIVAAADRAAPGLTAFDATLLVGGWLLVSGAVAVGAKRAGMRMTPEDAFGALVYWPLQSLAGMFSLWQLVACPHRWEKTPHEPVALVELTPQREAA